MAHLKLEFTIVYDWLANRADLSWPEKIVIAHVLRYGKSKFGCFKSNGSISKSLGLSRVSVIRIINRLDSDGWLVKRDVPNRGRSLFVNQEKLDNMPLLSGIKGCGKPVSFAVKSSEGSGAAPPGSGAAPPRASGAAPLPLSRKRRQCLLLDIEERKEETDFSSPKRRERLTPSAEQFESQRRILIEQVKGILHE